MNHANVKIGSKQLLPLSAFIICKNEASCIKNCILSLAQCSEIIVVDSGSTDGTLELIGELKKSGWPIKLLQRPWNGFSEQKQFALEQCSQEWAINIDADERLDDDFRESLPRLIRDYSNVSAWRIKRRPYLIGYGYVPRFVNEGYMLRLVRRKLAQYDLSLKVHEAIIIKGNVKVAPKGSMLHLRLFSIDEQIKKEVGYSSLKVDQLVIRGRKFSLIKMLLNPVIYFIRIYFLRRMFLCGIGGVITGLTGSIYAFVTEAKLYQVNKMNSPVDESKELKL